MGNRMLKDSLCSSDKIASLSDFEFRLWVGLILSVDDVGRGDARPAIIKGRVFPLRERVTVKEISDALHGLAAKGCVSLYTVGGKPYFWFPTWGNHQRIRDCRPKYPGPDDADIFDNSPQSAADCGNLPQNAARTINQLELETNTKEKEKGGQAATRFTPPTVEEVESYIQERKSTVDAQQFVDFYASKGWMVGKNRMKDWKAAVRTWEKREETDTSGWRTSGKSAQKWEPETTTVDQKEFERLQKLHELMMNG